MAETVSFTDRRLANLEPGSGLFYLNDAKLTGLTLAVQPTGTKTFQVVRKLNGRTKRITIGRFPNVSVSDARKLAQQTIAQMVAGTDSTAEKRFKKPSLIAAIIRLASATYCAKSHSVADALAVR